MPVRKYHKQSTKAFVIPGLKESFIPQGISYDSGTDNFFITGYTKNGLASPIYVVNKTSKKLITNVRLAYENGAAFTGHAGGLSVYDDMVYVAGGHDNCLYGLKKSDILNASKNSTVNFCNTINLKTENDGIGVAFTTVKDDLIFAGEFYKEVVYPTLESHHMKTGGEINRAIAVGFVPDSSNPEIKIAYSIPDNVQGMCFGEDGILLSTSYGPAFSHIKKYLYTDIKQNGTVTILNQEVPLYFLEESICSDNIKIAPMSEEIEYVDGKYYIVNESASSKYIFGKFTGGKWCLASKF